MPHKKTNNSKPESIYAKVGFNIKGEGLAEKTYPPNTANSIGNNIQSAKAWGINE